MISQSPLKSRTKRGGAEHAEWIIAMFLIGALLSAGDMAKIFLEARRSRREAAVYDNHPQKLQMEHYADSFRVLAESFYQMPSKSAMPETGRVDKILEKNSRKSAAAVRRRRGAGSSTET